MTDATCAHNRGVAQWSSSKYRVGRVLFNPPSRMEQRVKENPPYGPGASWASLASLLPVEEQHILGEVLPISNIKRRRHCKELPLFSLWAFGSRDAMRGERFPAGIHDDVRKIERLIAGGCCPVPEANRYFGRADRTVQSVCFFEMRAVNGTAALIFVFELLDRLVADEIRL